ncbi:hypothetical protein RYX36_006085 [Vicia faba]
MVDGWVNETKVEKKGFESVHNFTIKKFGLCSRDTTECGSDSKAEFDLERGVPTMVAVFATRRFPSQDFDLIHCSHCRNNWTQDVMLNITTRLYRMFLKNDGYIAVWQKPFNNRWYLSRDAGNKPPLCDLIDDPDDVWYCIQAFWIFQ